jgi:pyrroline-5-carboxylate reductase
MGPEERTEVPPRSHSATADEGLLLVGCGKMGGALLRGWLEGGYNPDEIAVVEPSRASVESTIGDHPVRIFDSIQELGTDIRPRVVLFAVKPQMMEEIVPLYRPVAESGALIVSIAAGKTINFYENSLTKEAAVVRCMPNTPASVGRGITAAISNTNVSAEDRELCDELLHAVGEVVWLTDESQMDAVTALSGGGPAYVFLLVECLAEAGAAAGLDPDMAMELARTTVAGSGELLFQSDEPVAQLRRNVTSPQGTTEAAIRVLKDSGDLQELMTRAIAAATERSKELGG